MADVKFTLAANREYWEDPKTVSLLDRNLRELEVGFVSKYLAPGQHIADVGCGDGRATRRYAAQVAHCIGIERSTYLLDVARSHNEREPLPNLEFRAGDILELDLPAQSLDVVVTERVLINLPSWQLQRSAIDNVTACLKSGGMYVMVENTEDGDRALNELREQAGLEPIPQHWHNLFLDWDTLAAHVSDEFEIVERRGFGLYYLLTRVYAQMFASFTGFGADAKADPVFENLDPAARRLEELVGAEFRLGDRPVVGPIQGIALRKR